jgi:hypothetical protein
VPAAPVAGLRLWPHAGKLFRRPVSFPWRRSAQVPVQAGGPSPVRDTAFVAHAHACIHFVSLPLVKR